MENSLIGTVWRHRAAEENPAPESIQEDVCGFQNLEIRWIAAITTADQFHGNDDLARRCGRRTTPQVHSETIVLSRVSKYGEDLGHPTYKGSSVCHLNVVFFGPEGTPNSFQRNLPIWRQNHQHAQ
jgi:hypothetical protein